MRRRAPAVASIHYSSTPRTRPRSPLPEWRAPMNVFVLGLAASLALVPRAQPASPLGDDPAMFDRLFDAAYLRRDVAFVEAAVADDVRFKPAPAPDATTWNKEQLLNDVRIFDALERNVDSVVVESHGNRVNTHGHIQVKTSRADGPEYHVYYARVYRRGPRGWVLASHETMARADGATPSGVFRQGDGVTQPRLLKDVKPQYTSDAMRAKIQGGVLLEVVVNVDGTVGEVRVVRSLDRWYGLDDQAVNAAKMWRFTPGTKDGQPVPVLVTIEMTFTLGR